MKELFYGVYEHEGNILTENKTPGSSVYGERTIKIRGKEYRVWDPFRSKLCAAIKKGLKNWFFRENSRVLYLGAAEGTTASHIADIVRKGVVFCVDVAPRVMPKLVKVCEERENMIPILANAGNPNEYREYIGEVGGVDIIYEDVAHPEQTDFLIKNAEEFMENGYAYIAVKARSIDVTKDPSKIFLKEEEKMKKYFEIIEKISLEPYEKDHMLFVLEKK